MMHNHRGGWANPIISVTRFKIHYGRVLKMGIRSYNTEILLANLRPECCILEFWNWSWKGECQSTVVIPENIQIELRYLVSGILLALTRNYFVGPIRVSTIFDILPIYSPFAKPVSKPSRVKFNTLLNPMTLSTNVAVYGGIGLLCLQNLIALRADQSPWSVATPITEIIDSSYWILSKIHSLLKKKTKIMS